LSTTTAAATSYYAGTYYGRPDQVRRVRAAVAGHLTGCPVADDAVLIVSEIVSNAIVHSDSAGDFFTVRVEAYPGYLWILWNAPASQSTESVLRGNPRR